MLSRLLCLAPGRLARRGVVAASQVEVASCSGTSSCSTVAALQQRFLCGLPSGGSRLLGTGAPAPVPRWTAGAGQALWPRAAAAPPSWQPQQLRGAFTKLPPRGPPANPQNHNPHPLPRRGRIGIGRTVVPKHLAGRFVLDRNGNVWRQPGWRKKKRRLSSAGRLNRLKRIRALHTPIARKMVLVGFRSRFWADVPDARIPGFHEGQNQLVGGAAQPVADGTIRQADLRRF